MLDERVAEAATGAGASAVVVKCCDIVGRGRTERDVTPRMATATPQATNKCTCLVERDGAGNNAGSMADIVRWFSEQTLNTGEQTRSFHHVQ